VAVICAAQANRTAGDGSQEVFFESARGSGQIEEAADFLIGMWRPDQDKNINKPVDTMKMKLLKNRKGPTGLTYDMRFTVKSLRIDDQEDSFWSSIDNDDQDYEEVEIL